jgi:hypothetical protein
LLFQTLDDKKHCVGIYQGGDIFYDAIPDDLTKTWSYAPYLQGRGIQYASLYVGGRSLGEVCPQDLKEEWSRISNKMKAFIKAFTISKIDIKDVCLFSLIPDTFLLEWCEIKNKICGYVFENYEKPSNYDFLLDLATITEKIKAQKLNIDPSELKTQLGSYRSRAFLKKLNRIDPFIYYNIFGTITGRLTTKTNSFPILTLDKKHRRVLKPNNDLLVELDYNAAELRTFLALSGQEQPQKDLHTWNIENVFRGMGTRDEAKIRLFAWLYNPNSDDYLLNRTYDREKLLKESWKNGKITTKFDRTIEVDERRALNYLIQSTSSDLFLRQMIKISKILEDTRSYVAFSLHDSVILDFAAEDKHLLPRIIEVFGDTQFGKYLVNASIGKDYGNMRKFK